jgi:hypothetical protein
MYSLKGEFPSLRNDRTVKTLLQNRGKYKITWTKHHQISESNKPTNYITNFTCLVRTYSVHNSLIVATEADPKRVVLLEKFVRRPMSDNCIHCRVVLDLEDCWNLWSPAESEEKA